jgi:hypothetical protein
MLFISNKPIRREIDTIATAELPRQFSPAGPAIFRDHWLTLEFHDKAEEDHHGTKHTRGRLILSVLLPQAHITALPSAARETLSRSLQYTKPDLWLGTQGAGVERQRTATGSYRRQSVEHPVWLVQHADLLSRTAATFLAWQEHYTREQAEAFVSSVVRSLEWQPGFDQRSLRTAAV